MISLNGVAKTYKKGNSVIHALKEITLNIEQGEVFGIIGRKGAGKSSLIRCINLLEHPSKGAVIVDSCDLTTLNNEELRRARRKIGMVFQHFNLLNSRTVYGNVALPLELARVPKATIEKTVAYLLDLSGLADKSEIYPSGLNVLEKQKVAIARALANQPKVLLCEEATAALDTKGKQSILQLLSDINQHMKLTILLITHEIAVVKSVCHRVAVLHQGELIEQAEVVELFTRPKTEITKEFIKTAARYDLPSTLRNRLHFQLEENCSPILRISFISTLVQEPFIADIIQQFNLTINIIQAHMENIQKTTIGIMTVEMIGNYEAVKKAIQALENKDLYIEVLGYAPRSA